MRLLLPQVNDKESVADSDSRWAYRFAQGLTLSAKKNYSIFTGTTGDAHEVEVPTLAKQ
jgi:hypothetical protein